MKPVNRNEAPTQAQEAPQHPGEPKKAGAGIKGRKRDGAPKPPADQRKRLSFVCGALAAVTVASLGVGGWQMSQAQQVRDRYESGLVQVVTATADVEPGEYLEASDFQVSSVPRQFAPADAATSTDEVVGLRANARITAGNALSLSTLQASAKPATLASAPEEGKVAYMVTLSAASGISPLLHVGDRVEVIMGADGVDGQVVASDVRVIALDDALSGSSDDYTNVTLELDEDLATMLYNYVDLGSGSIHLALNPAGPATADAPAGAQE